LLPLTAYLLPDFGSILSEASNEVCILDPLNVVAAVLPAPRLHERDHRGGDARVGTSE